MLLVYYIYAICYTHINCIANIPHLGTCIHTLHSRSESAHSLLFLSTSCPQRFLHKQQRVSRILGNGNGSGKRERELPFAISLTIKPIALKSLSHCHIYKILSGSVYNAEPIVTAGDCHTEIVYFAKNHYSLNNC